MDQMLDPFLRVPKHINQFLLWAAWFRLILVHPSSREWQADQDALRSRAWHTETEGSSTVVNNIEFNIPPPSNLLPLFLLFIERRILPSVDDG